MDCCKTKDTEGCSRDINNSTFFESADKKPHLEKSKELKGGKRKMTRRIVLWIVIGVLFVTALFLTFKAGAGNAGTVQAAGSAAKTAASSYGGMVGGC